MHADIDGATRIVRLATEFNWTWHPDDIPRFCTTAGWEITLDDGAFELRTNLEVRRPEASAYTRNHCISYIEFYVTDSATKEIPFAESREQAVEALLDISTALSGFLGEPTRMSPVPKAKVWWYFPSVVIEAAEVNRFVVIRLNNPEYQARLDNSESSE